MHNRLVSRALQLAARTRERLVFRAARVSDDGFILLEKPYSLESMQRSLLLARSSSARPALSALAEK